MKMSAIWDYGIVAFLDILGFSNFVESDARAAEPKHLKHLMASLAEVKSSITASSLDLRSFSDSVILSGPLSLGAVCDLTRSVVSLQRTFISQGILVRGAIAFGKHYADADSMYSEALIRAYKLERDHARFPRVLFDKDLLDWFINNDKTSSSQRKKVQELLLRDRDGHAFLHYLDDSLLHAHNQLVIAQNCSNVTASVLEKFQWLAAYHNYVARVVGTSVIVNERLVREFTSLDNSHDEDLKADSTAPSDSACERRIAPSGRASYRAR